MAPVVFLQVGRPSEKHPLGGFAGAIMGIGDKERAMDKRAFQLAALAAVWATNPVYSGCGAVHGPSFGQEGMLSLMDSLNEEAWRTESGAGSYELWFSLEQAAGEQASLPRGLGLLGEAHACGERTFFASAEACLEVSTLALVGTVSIRDPETKEQIGGDVALDGAMYVYGYDLDNAEVQLLHASGEFTFRSTDGVVLDLEKAAW
jgi:hypothetical protein